MSWFSNIFGGSSENNKRPRKRSQPAKRGGGHRAPRGKRSGVERPESLAPTQYSSFADIEAAFHGEQSGGSMSVWQGSPEFDYFQALGTLKRILREPVDRVAHETLAHGYEHLARLVGYAPLDQRFLKLISEYEGLAERFGVDLYTPGPEGLSHNVAALKARRMARSGQLQEAISLLLQIQSMVPDSTFLESWVPEWLEPGPQGDPIAMFEPMFVGQIAVILLHTTIDFKSLPQRRVEPCRKVARACARLNCDALPPAVRMELEILFAGLFRVVGLFAETEAILKKMARVNDDWQIHYGFAKLAQERGQLQKVPGHFLKAIELNPQKAHNYSHLYNHYRDIGDWTKAKQIAIRARKAVSGMGFEGVVGFFSWAERSQGNFHTEPPKSVIEALRAQSPAVQEQMQRFRAYDGYWPKPSDGTINVIANTIEQFRDNPEITDFSSATMAVALGAYEPPSSAIAGMQILDFYMPGATMNIGKPHAMQQPDPRVPLGPVKYPVWRQTGEVLQPIHRDTGEFVTEIVCDLATLPFSMATLSGQASQMAEDLEEEHIEQLLGILVAPPPIPEGQDAFGWMGRVQLAACFLIANIGTKWHGSKRRDALLSLLFGPRDWLTGTAAFALADFVQNNPLHFVDVFSKINQVENSTSPREFVGFELPLLHALVSLPMIFDEQREYYAKRIEQFEAALEYKNR